MADSLCPNMEFDLRLAVECAVAYAASTGLGCTVSDAEGALLYETGNGCASCRVCALAGRSKEGCIRAHTYGMTEAERFGGKYIYFCPMGLTCFVSPILGQAGSAAKITVGPFLMVDLDDYQAFDLEEKLRLGQAATRRVLAEISVLPVVSPAKVNSLSALLFFSVGFLNNVSDASRMLEAQDAEALQGQVGDYILELKGRERPPAYPVETEQALLASIAALDKARARVLLNELLGHILFASGGDLNRIKTRVYELLALISRAAMNAGASMEWALDVNHQFFQKTQGSGNIEELCSLLAGVVNRYIDSLFEFSDVQNVDVIHKAVQFMRANHAKKICLEDVAKTVYLSPTYFGKVFKKEMGCSFTTYLNRLRVERSKQLILSEGIRLVDIASMVGFEDQSYFTKVFKRVTGVSPNQYRKSGGRMYQAGTKDTP